MDAHQRGEIIEYARKVIIQSGVKSLRMDDIAQATRVSKRTLYEEFGDKEELIFLAAQKHFDSFDQKNLEAAKETPNILIAMLVIMEEIRKNAEVNWQLRKAIKFFYPNVHNRLWLDKADQKREIVFESLTKAIRAGLIRDNINIDLTLNIFTYIAVGISENNEMLTIPDGVSINTAFQQVLVSYIRGISTIKGVEVIDEFIKTRDNQSINKSN